MSKAEPKAELDERAATTGSGPPNDYSGKTNSVENDKQLSAVGEVADVGEECKEQRKYDEEKMMESGNANATDGEYPKVAEADDLNNEEAEDTGKEKDKDARKEKSMDKEKENTVDMKKEKCEDTNKEETKNSKEEANGNAEDMNKKEGKDKKMEEVDNTNEEAKDATKEDVKDIKKDGEDVKKKEAVGMKEAKDTAKEEAKDMKNEEPKDMNEDGICSVRDVDMEDKEVGDETMDEEKDLTEEKDNREVKKNREEHKEAEGEVEVEGTRRGGLDNVKDVDMEDQEVGDKNGVEVKDVREEKDNKEIKEKLVENKEAERETEAKDARMEEVDSADDVDMENKEARDKKIEDKDVTEVKDDGEVKKKDEESKEAEREAETGGMKRGEIESVIDVNMGDKEVGDKKMENNKHVTEEKDNGEIKMKVEESREAEGEGEGLKKKGIRGKKISEKGESKEKKGEKMAEEIGTPIRSSIERPVRERRSVERLVEALDGESVKPLIIEKGRGTPLKDIPNVAYKVSKKRPAQLKLIHQTLFGRIGKAINYKNNILQFSGFVWHESEDKQKTKVKEKLDKCIKDTLLDFCDLFDLPVLKAKSNARKEELVAMLLDFMVAPHATTDVILSEQEKQSTNSKKRKRGVKGSGSKSSGSLSGKRSHMGNIESEVSPNTKGMSAHEMEDEEEDDKNGVPSEDGAPEHSESEEKEVVSEAAAEDEKNDEPGNGWQQIQSPKKGDSADTKKSKVSAGPKKMSSPTTAKSPTKSSSSKQSKAEDKTNGGTKILSRNEKEIEQPRKKTAHSKTDFQEKSSGKKAAKGKAKTKESGESGPSKEELRKTICEILNRVDFNTATFTDILKELASHYGMDLTPRKPLIKLMVQEELTKLADEDEDEDDSDEVK